MPMGEQGQSGQRTGLLGWQRPDPHPRCKTVRVGGSLEVLATAHCTDPETEAQHTEQGPPGFGSAASIQSQILLFPTRAAGGGLIQQLSTPTAQEKELVSFWKQYFIRASAGGTWALLCKIHQVTAVPTLAVKAPGLSHLRVDKWLRRPQVALYTQGGP